jgi:hypothetical protein
MGGELPPTAASFDGQIWTSHPFAEDDAVSAVHDIAVGLDGVAWVGAQAPGLLRWKGQTWQTLNDPEGLTGWQIYDVEIDDHGIVWCATARGLVYYSNGAWYGQGGGETRAIEFGADDTVYLLASGGQVWRYAADQWTKLPKPKVEGFLRAEALHVAVDDAVWLGTNEGAFRYDGQIWRQFTAQDGLPANDVSAIAQDAGGSPLGGDQGWLWFGTENGAARVDPATLDLSPVTWPSAPTPTSRPGPTLAPAQMTPTPAPCALPPAEPFAAMHADRRIAEKLGCPLAGPLTTPAAFQPFEQGLMFWRADQHTVYVLNADGRVASYPDTWDDSQPAYDASLVPPAGLHQPVRGFGKVWRERLGGPVDSIGWALTEERGYEMVVQPFARGQMLLGPGGDGFVLYTDGTWSRQEQP